LAESAHQGICANSDGCRHRHDDPQNARRRYRCRLRPVGRRSQGPHACAGTDEENDRIPGKIRQGFRTHRGDFILRIKRCLACAATAVLSAVLLAGCATSPGATSAGEQSAEQDRVDVQRRASIRLQLAIGYYQQRQWQTALNEARQAVQIDPTMTDAYTMAALTYMELGDARQAEE